MPVKVVSRSTTNALNSGSSSSLTGNVMDWMETTIRMEASVGFKTGADYTVLINNDGTIQLYGGLWSDLGFEIGDSVTLNLIATDASNLLSPSVNLAGGTLSITDIQGDVMTVSSPVTILSATITCPGQDAVYNYNYFEIKIDKTFTGLDFKYNQMLNSDYNSPTLNSVLDTTQTIFKLNGLDVGNTSYSSLIPINPKSGNGVYSCEVKGVSKVDGISTFDIKILHNIVGFYDETSDIQLDEKPDWYDANECPTDTYQAKFYKTFGDENVTVESGLLDTVVRKLGNVGWFNENKNGLTNNYSISNVTYEDGSANALGGVQSSGETTINFTVTSATSSFNSGTSKFNFGIAFAALDRSANTNNSAISLENITANTMGINQAYSHSASPTVATINGFTNLEGARIDVKSYQFEVISSTEVEVTIIVEPINFSTYLDTLTLSDRQLAFWVSVGNNSAMSSTDRVSLMQPCLVVDAAVSVEPYPIDNVEYYPYDLDFYNGDTPYQYTLTEREIITEDDLHINFKFKLPDGSKINSVTFGIDIADSSGNLLYVADSYSENLTNQPVDFSGTQQIALTSNRQFKYLNGFKDNVISLQRDSANDSGTDKAFNFTSPYRIRWEWWKLNNSLPTSFFNPAQPNDNLNYEWFTKQFLATQFRHFMELSITDEDGVTTEYRNTYNLNTYNYDTVKELTKVIEVYPDDTYTTNSYIGTLTNKYTGDNYAIIDNQDNFIKCTLSSGGTNLTNHRYAEVTIEINDGTGWLSMWKIRSDQTPEANNPLQPLAGETALKIVNATSSEIELYCKVNPNLLQGVDYKITAEWVAYRDSGEEFYEYFERQIAFAKILRLAEPDPTEERSFGKCDYKIPVLASTTSDELYKNDILGLLYKRSDSLFNIELYLIDGCGNEYPLTDNTYGTYLPFGSFTYEPDVIAYQIAWRNVLAELGEGCYSFKRVNTQFGSETIFYSCHYELKEFSIANAENTVRVETIQNGLLEELDINFKGMNWGSHLRFQGSFGYQEPTYEQDFIIDTNNNKQLNRQDLTSEYLLDSKIIPHKCITKQLWEYYLRGTELFISDYNSDNHSYDYKSFAVALVNPETPKYLSRNRGAIIKVRFSERVLKYRLTTAEGDRPLSYLSPDYVWSDQCPASGGNVDVNINGSSFGSPSCGSTFDIDVEDTNGLTVGSKIGSQWIVPAADKDLTIAIPYEEDDDTSSVEIIANAVGTITSATTTLTSVVYKVNTVVVTIPFTVALTNTLAIEYDAAPSDGTIILNGSYV